MFSLKPDSEKTSLDVWDHSVFRENEIRTDVLRLDKIHPDISGNKWFKLKYHLERAKRTNKSTLVSFGGAYSNHLLALAAASREFGLNSIGFIRGENPVVQSHTLKAAKQYGMELIFLSRSEYEQKKRWALSDDWEQSSTGFKFRNNSEILLIPEGGSGAEGLKGCEEIMSFIPSEEYTHVGTAVGTGTTLAGIINASGSNQKIFGVSVLKGTRDLEPMDMNWIKNKNILVRTHMVHDYHFGGYAKYDMELIRFMNETYIESGIPTDFVYTGKLFFAVIRMAVLKLFPPGSRLLVIHTGGLQGNRSLTPGLLGF